MRQTMLLIYVCLQVSCVAGGGGTNHIPVKSAVYGAGVKFVARSAPADFHKQVFLHYECGLTGLKSIVPMNMDGVTSNGRNWSLDYRFTVKDVISIESTYTVKYKIVFIRTRPYNDITEDVHGIYSVDIMPAAAELGRPVGSPGGQIGLMKDGMIFSM